MIVAGELPVEEVIKLIPMERSEEKIHVTLFEVKIQVSSDRLRNFKKNGTKCIRCGIEGTIARVEKHHIKRDDWHINVYAKVDSKAILMTKDHILPKIRGGKNILDNYQVMCENCNCDKGCRLPEEEALGIPKELVEREIRMGRRK